MKNKQKELIDCNQQKHTIVGTTLSSIIRINAIYSTCYYKYSEKFIFNGERHDFWELVYVDKGSVLIQSEEDEFALSQLQYFLHAPNEFHAIRSNSQLSNVIIISFDSTSPVLLKLVKTVFNTTHTQKELLSNVLSCAQSLLSPLSSMPKEVAAYKKQLVKNYLELFFAHCFINETDKFVKKVNSDNMLIKSIVDYVEKNIGNKIEYRNLANHTGYSVSYICKVFKKHMKKTVLEYIIEQRIEKAQMLISQNKYKMKEISEMLGFDTVQYFSSQFKKHTSMTPSQYEQSALATNLLNPTELELINAK